MQYPLNILIFAVVEDIIVIENLVQALSYSPSEYLLHLFCLEGSVSFLLDRKNYSTEYPSCVIPSIGLPLEEVKPSDDFKCICMLARKSFIEKHRPQIPYNIVGHLGMTINPVLPMLPDEMEQCLLNIKQLQRQSARQFHSFHENIMEHAFQTFVLDMYDIHLRQGHMELKDAPQATVLMRRFTSLLQQGLCRTERQPSYYADRLCITPKYLNDVCQRVTHHNPTYWIDYFTCTEIRQLMADKSLTLQDIADKMHFSSMSYFSRYCSRLFGKTPSQLRE